MTNYSSKQTIQVRNNQFNIEIMKGGSGEPVLYIHGADGFPEWEEYLDQLASSYEVYVPAHPGVSNSTGLEALDNLWDLVLFYDELIDSLNLQSVHLIGHSYGGMIAAELAASFPNKIKSLSLISSLGLWIESSPVTDFFILTADERKQLLWHNGESEIAIKKSTVPDDPSERALINVNRTITLAAIGKFCWPIPDKGLKKRIHRINMPTLLLWGDDDKIVPSDYGQLFNDLITHSKLIIIPECGHIPQLEKPQEFISAINDFIGAI